MGSERGCPVVVVVGSEGGCPVVVVVVAVVAV